MTQSSIMDPYKLVRNIVSGGHEEPMHLYVVVKLITTCVSPFKEMEDGATIFEIAAKKNREKYIYMFVNHWAMNPSWNLHDEVYKLQSSGDKATIRKIEDYVIKYKESSSVVNHLLNILRISLV